VARSAVSKRLNPVHAPTSLHPGLKQIQLLKQALLFSTADAGQGPECSDRTRSSGSPQH